MDALFHLRDHGYEHLTELTMDGLLSRLTETTWVRTGAVLGPEDRVEALRSQVPPRLVLSHSTAWWIHTGLGRAPSPLTFITVPRRRFVEDIDAVVHELRLSRDDFTVIGGLGVTTEERTLFDLLLPFARSRTATADRDRSTLSISAVRHLVEEMPVPARRRFSLYLEGISRRPYVGHVRDIFHQVCAGLG
ncbi:hypothetical protein DFO66_1082 [Brevibacterium sanguinis]|uniref:Transcriptional regulator with AbiEi antitoxin domain of type IV toxin-antitoxin system n=2 Tax=Brevibacterium TaxID=1696 RepID=A0A366IIY3_9MICO|nr:MULTISPECIES: hypothetical protein [Brevibacterium]RBP63910.1 hypothetical protein DFO66_1082 [Brevibacterium sanguinis]RBP70815.1 hypothetical protein DFO65_107137 [Brevibacterium celere]